MGSRIDVAEDRGQALPEKDVGRGHEGERRDDDLAGQAGGADGDVEPDSAVRHGNRVAHAEPRRQGLLELLNVRPVVRQPASVEQVVQPVATNRSRRPTLGRPTWSVDANAGAPPKTAKSSTRDFMRIEPWRSAGPDQGGIDQRGSR